MKTIKIIIFVSIWCSLGLTRVYAVTSVTSYKESVASVGRYKKFEGTFTISRQFPAGSFLPYYYFDATDTSGISPGRISPYGADGITINGVFISPSGKQLIVPAFYFQDYLREGDKMTPTNNFSWKIRFAPSEIGTYKYYLAIQDKDGSSRYPTASELQFESTQSESAGFIRVSPRDARFLQFDNGASFVPNSAGRQWMRPGRTTSYEKAFTDFKTYGINFTRIWDQNDGYGLTVEGHFDGYKYPDDFSLANKDDVARSISKGTQMNQRGNFEEDIIIQAAEKNGVYIQLASHGDPYWIWDASIYKEGWNLNPVGFDTKEHLDYWKRNFRYRVARWGYSTAIVAWETWNEHGHIYANSALNNFYKLYGDFQKKTDPYGHLRTTSQGSQSWSPGFWSSSVVDLANYHDYMMISRYSADLTYDTANFVYRFAQCLRSISTGSCGLSLGDGSSWQGAPKPIIWGELDTGTSNWNESNHQPKATHVMRWAGLFSPLGMSPIDWYWDSESLEYTQKKYRDAKIAADFFAGVDYAGKKFTYLATADVKINSESINTNNSGLRVLAMRSNSNAELYAWAQNKADARWDQPTNTSVLSASFTVPGMQSGNYRIEYWNTSTGVITRNTEISVNNGALTIPVTNLATDMAIKAVSTFAGSTSVPVKRVGDANNDGMVNGLDYVIWLNNYGKTSSSGVTTGDFNTDGRTDGVDYVLWLNNY